MRAHTKANSGHAGNHATSSPGVPFVMRWKLGHRGRDPRVDQKDRGLWEQNCGIICNLLLGQRYMTLKMKNAHKLTALADNEVINYVVSVWKVVFWHLVASTHGISVFQSDQIRLDWTTPG